MTINEDCIRDILGYLVKNIDYEKDIDGSFRVVQVSLFQLYKDADLSTLYKDKDIMYSVLKLLEIHFIKVSDIFPKNQSIIDRCAICEVTYTGHKFYETIQPESVWNKTKSIVGKIGNHTLGFIESVAHDVAVESAKEFVRISSGNV